MSIDDRLRAIYDNVGGSFYWEGSVGKDSVEEEEFRTDFVSKVKQAFIDEGWVHIPQVEIVERWERSKPTEYRVNGKIMMTGPEWYAAFEREAAEVQINESDTSASGGYHQARVMQQIYKAARRASGMEEKE